MMKGWQAESVSLLARFTYFPTESQLLQLPSLGKTGIKYPVFLITDFDPTRLAARLLHTPILSISPHSILEQHVCICNRKYRVRVSSSPISRQGQRSKSNTFVHTKPSYIAMKIVNYLFLAN